MRTIIIGDIHGCFQELQTLLKAVDFDQKTDRLISIGDLMDRGEQSYEVLMFFIRMKQEMGDRCIIIRGNHEQMLLDATNFIGMRLWRQNGAEYTIRSFREHRKDVFDYTDWIHENTVLYYTGDGFQCVHAGLDQEDLAANDTDTLIWDRDAVTGNFYTGRLTIVGHTPYQEPVHLKGNGTFGILEEKCTYRLPKSGIICIDTGCVFGYQLTALVIEGHYCHIVSVPWEGEKT